MNKYWLVSWNILSKYGDCMNNDVWEGSLCDLHKLLRSESKSCYITIINTVEITKEEHDGFWDDYEQD